MLPVKRGPAPRLKTSPQNQRVHRLCRLPRCEVLNVRAGAALENTAGEERNACSCPGHQDATLLPLAAVLILPPPPPPLPPLHRPFIRCDATLWEDLALPGGRETRRVTWLSNPAARRSNTAPFRNRSPSGGHEQRSRAKVTQSDT